MAAQPARASSSWRAWRAPLVWAVCSTVSVVMAAAAGWLWWQARSHDHALLNYRAAAAEVENIGRLAADWRREISRVWPDALADEGALDSFAAEIAQHRQNLVHAVLGLPRMSARLANDLSAYGNAIDAHAKRVAQFQSNLAATRAGHADAPTVELLAAATATDLDPFAAALGATLERAAAATARVVARDQGTAVALAGGMSLPWIAFAVVRGAAARGIGRPRTSAPAPRAFARRRSRPIATDGAPGDATATTSIARAAEQPPSDDAALPPTGDVRATYALLRASVLADFLAAELADAATGGGRARLADLAHGLAASAKTQLGSNTHYEVLDVNECVDEAVSAGTRCGFVTVTKRPGVLPPVFASRAEVVVLLANIVENAVQAARQRHGDGGEIAVVTAAERGKATITITDNGAGLPAGPAKSRESLFKPFHALRDGHLGIGLATASKLVANNGGTITLASAAANEASGASERGDASATGTVARITLPHA